MALHAVRRVEPRQRKYVQTARARDAEHLGLCARHDRCRLRGLVEFRRCDTPARDLVDDDDAVLTDQHKDVKVAAVVCSRLVECRALVVGSALDSDSRRRRRHAERVEHARQRRAPEWSQLDRVAAEPKPAI